MLLLLMLPLYDSSSLHKVADDDCDYCHYDGDYDNTPLGKHPGVYDI